MLNLSKEAQIGIVSGAVGILVLMLICMICKLRRLNNPVYPDKSFTQESRPMSQCSDCNREKNTEMHRNSLDIRSSSFSPSKEKGTIQFSLLYQIDFKILVVQIIQGFNLVGRDFWEPVDSYIKLKLEPDPDRTLRGQTKIYRKKSDPDYNETFQFNIDLAVLLESVLLLLVWEIDKYSRHRMIGQVEIKLGHVVKPDVTIAMDIEIQELSKARLGLGELLFSLSYLPTAERLSVVIMKARNLSPTFTEWGAEPRDINPFVKVVLLFDGQKIKKKKTSTRRQENHPVYNEAMMFDVPPHFLHRVLFVISVADKTSDSRRSDVIGRVVIGSPSSGEALSHWHQMLVSPRRPVAAWHKLKL